MAANGDSIHVGDFIFASQATEIAFTSNGSPGPLLAEAAFGCFTDGGAFPRTQSALPCMQLRQPAPPASSRMPMARPTTPSSRHTPRTAEWRFAARAPLTARRSRPWAESTAPGSTRAGFKAARPFRLTPRLTGESGCLLTAPRAALRFARSVHREAAPSSPKRPGAVWASTRSARRRDDATALNVTGKSSFSRAGRGLVGKGKSSAVVSVPSGVATSSLILVTLQNAGSGVYLKYAARSDATHFRVVLSKVVPTNTYFAWFIVR